jgi:signal transduction histidine kinase
VTSTRVPTAPRGPLAATPVDGDAMLSRLGHELRGPAGALLGLVRLMRRKLEAGDADLTRYVELSEVSVTALLAVVDRVARLAKLESRPVPAGAVFDCRAAVEAVLAERAPECATAGVELSAALPPAPLWVAGEDWVAAAVLAELLDNALAHAGAARVRVSAGPAGLVVEDDGAGIAAADQRRLLEPFERGEGTDGCGLGLYAVRRLAGRIGDGRVAVRSAPGEGTAVTVGLAVLPGHAG